MSLSDTPLICPACNTSLPEKAQFCWHCGKPLKESNSRAGSDKLDMTAFHRLGPQEYLRNLMHRGERLVSERRIVTSLFADIVGSTALAEGLDPEDVTSIMNGAFKALAAPVKRYEGTLARLMGDGVLCLFGAPTAHEDDASRACRTALGMIENIKQLAVQYEKTYGLASFAVRVGISTGLTVVGEVGTESLAEYTAMGNSVNLAARLQGAADANSTVICEQTWQLVKRAFQCEDIGQLALKGKSEPVRAFRLMGSKKVAVEGQILAPLLGRDAELKQIKSLINSLGSSEGAVLCISGDAGIGKSRLVHETRRITSIKGKWAETRCHSYTRDTSYGAAQGILQGLLNIDATTSPGEAAQHLDTYLRDLAADNQTFDESDDSDRQHSVDLPLLPLIRYLLHIPLSATDLTIIESRKGEVLQRDLLSAFSQFIQLTASEDPLVLVWEDVHWIDAPSLEMLNSLARICQQLPLRLIITMRPEADRIGDCRENWRQSLQDHFMELRLPALDNEVSSQLLRHLFDDAAIPRDVLEPLVSIVGGNPFFLEEMFRTLADAGIDHIDGGDEHQAHSLTKFKVPRSVHGAILSRIDRLPFRDKKVLQFASVVSRTFLRDVLRTTLESEIHIDELDRSLHVLEFKNFIQRVAGQSEAPHIGEESRTADQQYTFTHAITAEVVYQSLLKSERRRLHQLAGEAIEDLFPDRIEEFVPTLAYHFDRSEDIGRAVSYLYRAGNQALVVFALDRARACYARGLQLSENGQSWKDGKNLTALLHEGLGNVHYFSSEYESALDHFDKALSIVDDTKRMAGLFRRKGKVLEKWGRYDSARESFENGLQAMGEDLDELEAGQIYNGLCLVQFHLGDMDEAARLGGVALELSETSDNDLGIAEACNNLAVISTRKAEWKQAEHYYQRCLEIYTHIRNRYGLATCYNNMGLLIMNQDEHRKALTCLRKSLSIFRSLGNQHGMARVYDNMSQVFYKMGDSRRSDRYMEKAVKILSEISTDPSGMTAELWQSGVW